MKVVTLQPHDRFGNQLFQYCFARGYARSIGAELQVGPWLGQQIFLVNDPPIAEKFPDRYDMDIEQWFGQTEINLTGWALHKKTLFYNRADAKAWLQFKPEILTALRDTPRLKLAAHIRHGDFITEAAFVAVSMNSYWDAMTDFGFNPCDAITVQQERPLGNAILDSLGIGFLADFYAMMNARVLFRANSTFSWWAATLGWNERIFAPQLEGITPRANDTQDVPFVEGNWPAISRAHPNCSDLHLEAL